jgi:autotransporter translocation and assembly factor TamB
MRVLRRSLQVLALVGTILVGIVCVALIASQTPWFKDWLRRYVVRESRQYLNGELSIGGLGGNLFFGVNLTDVAVSVSGQQVIAVRALSADYNVIQLLSGKGIDIASIVIDQPRLHVEHDASGWNLGRLVKAQEREADREGPGRPIDLPSIRVNEGSVTIDDRAPSSAYRLPSAIDGLTLASSFAYAPVHYSVTLDALSFRASSPDLALEQLTGGIAVHDDNLYIRKLRIRTADSRLDADGVVEQYLATPVIKVTTTGVASLPEIGRLVPAAEGYALTPSFDLTADGPVSRLAMDLDVKSEAGTVAGKVTADLAAPDLGARGTLNLQALNLAPILKDPAQRSDLTGKATVDLTLRSAPASAPALERLTGTFAFAGPTVVAAGYRASDVDVSGSIRGRQLSIDGRAHAYRGTATAQGTLTLPSAGQPLAFDLRGAADGLDLRNLPPSLGVPRLATDLSVEAYHVAGAGRRVEGTATLNQSTVEGATIADGTAAEFSVAGKEVSYAARGHVDDLDLQRIGQAFDIAALDRPDYATTLHTDFDVRGSGSTPAAMRLDATGTLTGSSALGATIPNLGYEAHLDGGELRVQAKGRIEGLNPGALSGRDALDGTVTATVDAEATIADISQPVTLEAVAGSGTVHLESSKIAGLQIDDADVQARYAAKAADITTLTVNGPALRVKASGPLALDTSGASNLQYHVEAIDVAALASLAGQEGVQGSAVLDGTITGNASSLATTGTLEGSDLGYQENTALALTSQYTVTIPDLTPADATVEAETKATFVKAGGLEINELQATTTYAGKRLEFVTSVVQPERSLDLTGNVVFHPDHQEIHLPQLALRTQGVEWQLAPGAEPAIQYGGDRIQLEDVRLVNGQQSIAVDGAFALKGDTPAGTLEVKAANVDLAEVDRLALLNRNISGTLDASATIEGTASAPAVSGHARVSNGGFQNYHYQSLDADVRYAGTRLGIDATLQQSPTESITAKGTVPTSLFRPSPGGHVAPTPEDALDLQVTSTALGLGIVQGFTNQVTNVTGTVTADVHLGGSGADPHVSGSIVIAGGGFGVPATGVSYSGLDTRIELTPEAVRIPHLRIIDEEGAALDIAGDLAVHARQVGAVNITISSNNFEIIDNELGDVGVETALQVTGELRRPVVKGEVKLQAARLEVDRILALFYDPYALQSLPEVPSASESVERSGSAEAATREALSRAGQTLPPAAETPADTEPGPGQTGAFAQVALDIHVRIPENLVLRGRNLRPGGPTGTSIGNINLTVGGDLDIQKDAGGPVRLLGTIDMVRGTYEFQGRRFDLVRGGTVRFTGDEQLNPILDISATREIPNTGVEATVHIRGTVQAPELTLSSTPPLDESDILSLIVFNRPVNELGSGERASLAATAGGIASGFIAQPLGRSIGRALDLDLFEITPTTTQGNLSAGITVGQQIGDRAFLKLQQEFGERLSTEFMLEFQIADYLRVQATGAPETTGSANRIGQRRIERAGIDLIFFFSY